jgi:hypothetical protein
MVFSCIWYLWSSIAKECSVLQEKMSEIQDVWGELLKELMQIAVVMTFQLCYNYSR